MTKGRSLENALNDYLPEGTSGRVLEWFSNHRVLLRITRSRRSKLGDFRTGTTHSLPAISVNHNLNSYSFLITLLHEMAHAEVYFRYKRRQQPHGEAWKQAYRELAKPFLESGVLPENVNGAFRRYLTNPSASSTSDIGLAEALRVFDQDTTATLISELPEDAVFALPDGRLFKRGVKLRKRYRCECLSNRRVYLFSPLAPVIPVKKESDQSLS
ncbi:MAG: SprT-like domain-containing protein [Bacteroidales bacterium]|nr:SprT-like domain-containing protein [Bacteroidales bacterium]